MTLSIDHGPAIAESLKGLFGGYLRTCRSGGMPRKLSEQVQASFDNFCHVYEREIYAAVLVALGRVSDEHTKCENPQGSSAQHASAVAEPDAHV